MGQYPGQFLLAGEDSTGLIAPQDIQFTLSVDSFNTVEDLPAPVHPTDFWRSQNFPNPFNQATQISYRLQRSGFISLKLFNLLGQEVATLVNQTQPAGHYQVTWDGRDNRGEALASGIYFYQLKTTSSTQSRKLTLLK